jgi:ribosomal protein S18 acetylase RimI-like enzyme
MDHRRVVALEEAALNGLPALTTEYYDGWMVRRSRGYSRRANCVVPLYPSHLPLKQKLEYCASTYARSGLPCLFKMTEASHPAAMDDYLVDQGYARDADTLVKTRPLEAAVPMPDQVALFTEPADEWLQTWETLSPRTQQSPILKELLGAVPAAAAYVVVRSSAGEPVGCARAVCSGTMLGLFDLLVAPAYRGQGLAKQLVEARLSWGFAHGARLVYLQVMENNAAAQALQSGFGFVDAYRYWYRVSPEAPTANEANC